MVTTGRGRRNPRRHHFLKERGEDARRRSGNPFLRPEDPGGSRKDSPSGRRVDLPEDLRRDPGEEEGRIRRRDPSLRGHRPEEAPGNRKEAPDVRPGRLSRKKGQEDLPDLRFRLRLSLLSEIRLSNRRIRRRRLSKRKADRLRRGTPSGRRKAQFAFHSTVIVTP